MQLFALKTVRGAVIVILLALILLCYAEPSTALTTLDCSSDAISLQDAPSSAVQDLLTADRGATHTADTTPQPNDHSRPPAVKKRGRGRPPVYKLTDRRKAQLREVSIPVQCPAPFFLCLWTGCMIVLKH